MKYRVYVFEIITLILFFFQAAVDAPLKYFLPFPIVTLTMSYYLEKTKVYTAIFYLLTAVHIIRMQTYPDSFFAKSIQISVIVAIAIIKVMVRSFDIIERFGLYESLVKEKREKIGYRYRRINDKSPLIGISYPTEEITGKKIKWTPNSEYYKKVYQSMHINPEKKRIIPKSILKFFLSYLKLYELPVEAESKLIPKRKYKIVFFSHGLAAHLNAYSVYTNWWASRGFIVISIEHDYDEICVDHRPLKPDEQKIKAYLLERRRLSLRTRVEQFKKVFSLVQKGYLDDIFGMKIQIEEILFAGHSFGAATILESGAQLMESSLYSKVIGYFCLDPWMFPVSETSYKNLEKRILFINSSTFTKQNPKFYELHKKNTRLNELNPEMFKIKVRKMDHVHPCDMIFVFGTLLKLNGTIKNFKKSQFYIEITILMAYLFEGGMSGQEIMNTVNQHINAKIKDEPNYLIKDQRLEWEQL